MFTHASAATAAASKTAAPPVSVRRKLRSGVCALRAQAVRPENPDGRGIRLPLRGLDTSRLYRPMAAASSSTCPGSAEAGKQMASPTPAASNPEMYCWTVASSLAHEAMIMSA